MIKALFDIQQRIYTMIKEKEEENEKKKASQVESSRVTVSRLVEEMKMLVMSHSSNSIIYKNASQLFEYIVYIELRNTNEIDIHNLLQLWSESFRNPDHNKELSTNLVH